MHKMGIFTLVSICTTPSRIVSIWLDKAPPASKNFFPFRFANQHHTLYCRFNLTSSLGPQKVTMQCLGVLSKFCTSFHSLSVWYWNDPRFRKWCRTEHPIWQWLLLHIFTTMAYWSGIGLELQNQQRLTYLFLSFWCPNTIPCLPLPLELDAFNINFQFCLANGRSCAFCHL